VKPQAARLLEDQTRTVVLNELVLNRELESILELQVDPRPHDSGELVVLRKANWTRVFGGLKLRPLEPSDSDFLPSRLVIIVSCVHTEQSR
jgi:hypothetical protein